MMNRTNLHHRCPERTQNASPQLDEGHIAQPTDKDGKWLTPVMAAQFVAADLVYTTPSQNACRLAVWSLIRDRFWLSQVYWSFNLSRKCNIGTLRTHSDLIVCPMRAELSMPESQTKDQRRKNDNFGTVTKLQESGSDGGSSGTDGPHPEDQSPVGSCDPFRFRR